MMDNDYIVNKLIEEIKDSLKKVDERLINGNVTSMEDYKYCIGMRHVLSCLLDKYNDFKFGK